MLLELNKIYNEDCKITLANIESKSIDFILTDPPYELDNHLGANGYDITKNSFQTGHLDYISNGFDMEIFNEFERVCKIPNIIIFCSNKQISKTMSWWEQKGYSTTLLIWNKPNTTPLNGGKYISDIEFMVYVRGIDATYNSIGVKQQSKLFQYLSPHKSVRIHPTEKPIALLQRLLLIHSNEGDVVLDCFSGSGSTARACIKEKRKFIGSEIDAEHFKEANKLIDGAMSQTFLF